nr:ABATE domain-containing protein [Streptomyces sp. AS58]
MRHMEAIAAEQLNVQPAPGAAQYPALDLANSVVALTSGQSVDLLDTPVAAGQWLAGHDLAPAAAVLDGDDAARLHGLRAHIRSLIDSSIHGGPASEDALDALNDALTGAPSAALLSWNPISGLHRTVARPRSEIVDHALARLASDAADLLTGADAERLTACGSNPCNRYLLRHGRRHWCSTRCGDRARAARAYARRTRSATP